MLILFFQNPLAYFVPFWIVLTVLIAGARFLPHLYRGEATILLKPEIIFGTAVIWPMSVPFALVGAIFWVAGKGIGFLIGSKSRESDSDRKR